MHFKQTYQSGLFHLKKSRELPTYVFVKQAIQLFKEVVDEAYVELVHMSDFSREIKKMQEEYIESFQKNPLLVTCLEKLFDNTTILQFYDMKALKDHIDQKYEEVTDHLEKVHIVIAQLGSQKIREKSTVFTHSYSSTVKNILLDARVRSVHFRVCNTESRPLLEGRELARELALHDIPIHHYIDSGIRQAIKRSNIVLLGCVAIDATYKMYGAIGAEMICQIAKEYGVPVYICADSWKYNAKVSQLFSMELENNNPDDIWLESPTNVALEDYRYEKIDGHLLTGIICEQGILSLKEFMNLGK